MYELGEGEEDLSLSWFKELLFSRSPYREPILDEQIRDKIKLLCDSIQQDSHVFLTAIDTVEEYIRIKNERKCKIGDQILVILTVVFLSGKFTGDIGDYKTTNLTSMYEKLTSRTITNRDVKLMEIEVLTTLNGRLPLHTRVDDLKLFLQCYVTPMSLNFDVSDLCEQLLVFVTIYNLRIFGSLKLHYLGNMEAYKAFIANYTNRAYLPIGVLLCALQITQAKNVVDLKAIVHEASSLTGIHSDHLLLLRNEIHGLWMFRRKQLKI